MISEIVFRLRARFYSIKDKMDSTISALDGWLSYLKHLTTFPAHSLQTNNTV